MAYERMYVTMTIRDAYNRSKTKTVELVTVDGAQAELDADIIQAAYQNVMNGHILKAQVNGLLEYPGVAAAGANVDTGVTMSCQLADRSEKASLKWPTPDPTIINADGTVNLADVNVIAVQNLYVALATNVARLSDGEAITQFLSGKLDK